MKERQRWQPEEDALLRAYVKQFGAREWNLIAHRMGKPLHRDPKSCLERWKNYLKPGLKKGSLTPEEQTLVISLQRKYGNKWKKIAAEVPGRTAKRLGKWWEVFKEKQLKNSNSNSNSPPNSGPPLGGPYDHILDTFAEKYVVPPRPPDPPEPVLSLAPAAIPPPPVTLPPWMAPAPASPGLSSLAHHFREVEEGRQSWAGHRKEAAWRLSRLEQQVEAEKARKRREKAEEVEAEIQRLRDEGAAFVASLEAECRERVAAVRREVEAEEASLIDSLYANHARLASLVQRLSSSASLP